MSRAAYDDFANVYTGTGTPIPLNYRFTVPCRLVPETRIQMIGPAIGSPSAHITYNGPFSSAGDTVILPPVYQVDLGTADVWELVSNPGVFYTVIRAEIVHPRFGGLLYRRVYVQDGLV